MYLLSYLLTYKADGIGGGVSMTRVLGLCVQVLIVDECRGLSDVSGCVNNISLSVIALRAHSTLSMSFTLRSEHTWLLSFVSCTQ